jgi:hypothetical protein
MPPSLAEVQRWLAQVFTEPRGIGAIATDDPRWLWLQAAPPLSRAERAHIYAEAYFLRLSENLEATFPRLVHALGEDDFRRAVAHYLHQHPSSVFQIQLTGAKFPAFVADFLGETAPWAGPLATLEWAQVALRYHAGGVGPVIPGEPPLQLSQAFQILHLPWTVHGDSPLPEAVDITLWKQGYTVLFEPLAALDYCVLRGLSAGQPLVSVCDELAATLDPSPEEVSHCLQQWVSRGVIQVVVPGAGVPVEASSFNDRR